MSFLRSKVRGSVSVTGTLQDTDTTGILWSQQREFTPDTSATLEYSVPGDCPCHHIVNTWEGAGFNGTVSQTGPGYWNPTFYNLINWLEGVTLSATQLTVEDIPFSTARLLAATTPEKPAVSVPNFIFELKDVPEMLRVDGLRKLDERNRKNHWWDRSSQAYLAENFGWGPFVSDLFKMWDFGKATAERLAVLNKVYSKQGYSRKLSFGSKEAEATDRNRNMVWGRGDTQHNTKVEVWGSVRWRATYPAPEDDRIRQLQAAQLALGLGLTPKQLWDAVPWSWFVDWFTNIGDYLAATQNSYGLYPTDVFKHTKATAVSFDVRIDPYRGTYSGADTAAATLVCDGGVARRVSYARTIAPPATLDANVPALTAQHVETATALILSGQSRHFRS